MEDFPNAFACAGRALEIVSCADLLGDCLALQKDVKRVRIGVEILWGNKLASSGATGRWDVLRRSSRVLGSLLRSFLQATRIIGKRGQKCMTSAIH